MDDTIPKTSYPIPINTLMLRLKLLRETICGLAYDLEIASDRIDGFLIDGELLKTHSGGVSLNFLS